MKNTLLSVIMVLSTFLAKATSTDSFVHIIIKPVSGPDSSCQYVFKTTGCSSGSIILNEENHAQLLPKEMPASMWTYSANSCNDGTTRSFLKFNTLISSIPTTAIVDSVFLNLYGVSTSMALNAGNSYYPGSPNGTNPLIISRVLASWNRTTLTWNNQPTVSSSNTATVPASTSQWGYDARVDVTNMVKDMIAAGASYGFMLKQQTESVYHSMIFSSPYADDSTKRPTLSVYYHVSPSAIHTINSAVFDTENIVLYPSPALNAVNVKLLSNNSASINVKIFDLSGKVLQQEQVQVVRGDNTFNINTSNLSSGSYIINFGDGNNNVYRQFSKI